MKSKSSTVALIFFSESCEPYSIEACKDAALSLGLQLGGCGHLNEPTPLNEPFEGTKHKSGGEYAKGCHAYHAGHCNGVAFYGTGGTIESMKQPLSPPRYRPSGYDCIGEKKSIYTIQDLSKIKT